MIPVIALHCLPSHLPFFSVLLPFFSFCVGMFGPGSGPSYLNTQTRWTAGQPVEAQLWVNFALTLKLAVLVLAPSTQHQWLSKGEVSGTGKQEAPAR